MHLDLRKFWLASMRLLLLCSAVLVGTVLVRNVTTAFEQAVHGAITEITAPGR